MDKFRTKRSSGHFLVKYASFFGKKITQILPVQTSNSVLSETGGKLCEQIKQSSNMHIAFSKPFMSKQSSGNIETGLQNTR